MSREEATKETAALSRRAALAKLGLAAAGAYVAPALLKLSDAEAHSRPSFSWSGPSHPHRKHRHRHRWHWHRHPRRAYWIGRRFPDGHRDFVVIVDYRRYRLPPPPRRHFYVRVDNDVFLVAEATKRIVDAFVLLSAVGN